MKDLRNKIIVLLLLLTAANVQGQTLQELKAQIDVTQGQVNQIRLNLDQSHKQFKTGIEIIIAGSLATIIGLVSQDNNPNVKNHDRNTKVSKIVMWTGILIQSIGLIVMIDSHRVLTRKWK